MRYHRHIRKRPIAEINVVPYIDVMLVLLIIFMVTAPLLQHGVEVDLPKADAVPAVHDTNDEILVINVDKDGKLYSQVGERPKEPISLEELKAQMVVFQNRKPNQPIYFGGDKDAKYGDVIQFFAILKSVGKDKLFLMTETPDS
jgi:biopolymer transport protein TolR